MAADSGKTVGSFFVNLPGRCFNGEIANLPGSGKDEKRGIRCCGNMKKVCKVRHLLFLIAFSGTGIYIFFSVQAYKSIGQSTKRVSGLRLRCIRKPEMYRKRRRNGVKYV